MRRARVDIIESRAMHEVDSAAGRFDGVRASDGLALTTRAASP
jgi:hypothetical protein